MAEENKEEILANFQSITGIEDVGEAFSHLEETDWDLMAAIQRVIPPEDGPLPPPPPLMRMDDGPLSNAVSTASSSSSPQRYGGLNNFSAIGAGTSSTFSTNHNRWSYNRMFAGGNSASGSTAAESAFVPVASTLADAEIIDLTSDIDLNPARHNSNDVGTLTFNIHFNQQIYTIQLPSNATVGQLKTKIADVTNVQSCRQAIRGWSPEKQQDAQYPTTKLSALGLSTENELILIDLTNDVSMDFDNEEVARRLMKKFNLNIVVQPSGRQIQLNFPGHTTVLEVKSNVFDVSDIPVRHQEWTGWPQGCDNNSTLAQCGIELSHNFILQNAASRSNNSLRPSTSSRTANASALDTDSSADEFEDASDFNPCEEFFTDTPQFQPPSRHLISNHTDNETTGSTEFVQNYAQRFGEPHPAFFIGSLEEALKEAFHKPARERKLLAIYLHHGESILTNVFCDHKLKNESIIQTFAQNFVLYGWDLTFETNKNLFLSSVTACISDTISRTVRIMLVDRLPSILFIRKNRTTYDVRPVIHGDVGLDDLLSRLLEEVEQYKVQLQVEIKEEEEREARNLVKAEQDMAYQVGLQADMAKDAAKRQKEAAIAAERKRIESERVEEDARKESIRMVAEQSLPQEPNEQDSDITKIRVRKPTGEFLERRFHIKNTLQDLLNYVASKGFLIEEYKLISSWPRRDLTSMDANQTLHSLRLFPQETVIVEER